MKLDTKINMREVYLNTLGGLSRQMWALNVECYKMNMKVLCCWIYPKETK